MKTEPLDFIQLSYNIANRTTDERLLPLALDKGIATIINRPYQRGGSIRESQGKTLAGLGRGDRLRQLGTVFP